MEQEYSNYQMEVIIKVSLSIIKYMEKVYSYLI